MLDSRKLSDLHSVVLPRYLAFKADYEMQVPGVKLLEVSTLRDNEMQQKLYNQGRTTPGRIVTKAKPGTSAHEYGIAVDAYPLIGGKILWVEDADGDRKMDIEWSEYGRIAKLHGFEWAGDWVSFRELPHIQYVGQFTFRDIRNNPGLLLELK